MTLQVSFTATGHPNVSARHKTTVMTTTEDHLSPRGDCIVAVNAELGLSDLPDEMKQAARSPDAVITLEIRASGMVFTVTGKGHRDLTFTHSHDIVARKSSYTCGRTLMVGADKASADIPPEMVEALRNNTRVTVTITVDL